jgi:ankyrin repeat protein
MVALPYTMQMQAIVAKPAAIEVLLANGSDVHVRNMYSRTALEMAASCGRRQCAKILISAGADVYSRDRDGAV